MTEFEPKQFGRYYLLEKLAMGGMAEIYKAKTFGVDGFEKLLVVKRILPHCAADREFISMLIDEAKLSVALSHANIVQVYDLGKVGDDYFFSMEYINGVNLRDIVYRCRDKNIKVPVEIAVYIISEICKGLDYAHRKADASGKPLNIVHRDVSPQNILISYEGEVKIVDFGIAKAAMNISHTMAGILKGKIAYMSPEQALGKPIDQKTDIFSTGILLYETLSSEKLFTGESQFEVLKKIRTTRVDASKLPASIPEELRRILSKALAYFPKDRYQSAGDMQIDLTKYLYTSYSDFTPQKLSAFIKDLFSDEISKQQQRGVLEAALEAKTSSINVAQESLQENIVHREDTSPTLQARSARDSSGISITDRGLRQAVETHKGGLGKRIAAVAGVLALVVGVGLALYFKQSAPPVNVSTGTINLKSEPSGAEIFLNGKDKNMTTPAIIDDLAIGRRYNIKLTKDPFEDAEETVLVDSTDPVNVDITLTVANGTIEVSSDPSGASIFIDGEPTGETTPATINDLPLNTDLKVTLKKTDFKDFEQLLTLTNTKPQKLVGMLSPVSKSSSIYVVSDPPGAQVFLNGRDSGLVTPATLSNIPVKDGQNIRITKTGYESITKVVKLEDATPIALSETLVATPEKQVQKEETKPTFASANVVSVPSGAKIILNGKNSGLKTPAQLKNMEMGKNYSIRLEKQNFESWTKEITVSSAVPINISGELKEIKKTEAVEKVSQTKEKPKPEEKKPEDKKIEEKKAEEKKPEEVAPRSYGVGAEPASIKVSSDPSGADVFINGENRGTTPTTITGIPPGSVSLLVNKEGKARYSGKISLSPGEKKDVGTLKLGGLYGSVSIVTTPVGASVFLDGENVGARTPLTIKKIGREQSHTLKLVLDGYKTWEKTFDMEGATEKKFNVTMEK